MTDPTPAPWTGLPIWPADWSQVVPDLFGGIFVAVLGGIVVGRVLSNRDAKREEAQRERAADRVYSALAPVVAEGMTEPWSWDFADVLNFSGQVSSLLDRVSPTQAAELRADAPKHAGIAQLDSLLYCARELRTMCRDFNTAVSKLVIGNDYMPSLLAQYILIGRCAPLEERTPFVTLTSVTPGDGAEAAAVDLLNTLKAKADAIEESAPWVAELWQMVREEVRGPD